MSMSMGDAMTLVSIRELVSKLSEGSAARTEFEAAFRRLQAERAANPSVTGTAVASVPVSSASAASAPVSSAAAPATAAGSPAGIARRSAAVAAVGAGSGSGAGAGAGAGTGPEDDKSNNDADVDMTAGSSLEAALQVLRRHTGRLRLKSPAAGLVLLVHACMVSQGFECTGRKDTDRTGFSTPIRILPSHQVVPPKWDAGRVFHFRYRHTSPEARGLTFLLKAKVTGGVVKVTLTAKEANVSKQFELRVEAAFVAMSSSLQFASQIPERLRNDAGDAAWFATLSSAVQEMASMTGPRAAAPGATTRAATATSSPATAAPAPAPRRPAAAPAPRHPYPSYPPAMPYYVPRPVPGMPGLFPRPPDFGGDLDPFGRGGGSLVGPSHPLFAGRHPSPAYPPMYGGVPPGARLDPYYPDVAGGVPAPRPSPGPYPQGGPPRPPVRLPGEGTNRSTGTGGPDHDHQEPPNDDDVL